MNIGFYVSGSGTRVKNIIRRENSEINSSIKIVVSDNENSELENLLYSNNITYKYVKKEEIENRKGSFSDILLDCIKKQNIDYLFVFGTKILKGEILRQYRNRIVNFHPAILPLFPGLNAIDRAVEAKMTILGNTAHFIDESIDGGPIILQSVVPVSIFYEEGYEGILKYQEKMFLTIYKLLKEHRIEIDETNEQVIISKSEKCGELLIPTIRH